MPSLYDNIQSINSQYVPKFVGSNYEQLSDAKKQLDERYYRNKDYSDKVAMMLAQEQYLDKDKDIKDKLAKSIYGQIDEISKSDANFENSSAGVSQLAKEFFTNQDRLTALDNYKRVEEAKKLRLQGYNLNFGDNLDNFSTIDPNTGEARRFNLNLEKQLNYDQQREQFYNQIEADLKAGKLKKADIEGLYGFVSQSSRETNIDKINKYLNDAITRYKSTPEYDQEKRKLVQIDGYSPEQADQVIKDNLASVGRERLLNRERIQYQQDPISIYAAKQELKNQQATVLDRGRTQYVNNPNLPANPFEGVSFNEDGTAVKKSRLEQDLSEQVMLPPSVGGLPTFQAIPEQEVTGEVIDAANRIKNTNEVSMPFLQSQYGKDAAQQYDLSKYTPKQIADLHTKAYDKMKSISADPIRPSKDILDVLTDLVTSSLPERSIYVLDNKGAPTQGGDYATAMEDLGLKGDDIVKAVEKAKVTGIAPFNPYNDSLAGGFTTTINTPDGQRTILVEADQGWQNLFQRTQLLSKAKMTGVNSIITPDQSLDGFGYVATPLLNKETGEYDVFVGRFDKNQRPVPFDEGNGKKSIYIKLDDVVDMDLHRLQQSGLLRSNLSRTKTSSVDNPNE